MSLNLSQHLAAVHDDLARFLAPDAVAMLDTVLSTLAANPAHLLPVPSMSVALVSSAATFFRLNVALELIEVTPALLALLEVANVADLLGRCWEQFLETDELKRRWEAWGIAVQTQRSLTHTFTFLTPTGRRILLCERLVPQRDPHTLVCTGWVAYVRVMAKVIKLHPQLTRRRA